MARHKRDVPWLEPRSNGVYYANWYDPEAKRTRRESMETSDPTEATLQFARFLTEGSRRSLAVGNAGVTASQLLTWYDESHVNTEAVVAKVRQRAAIANLKAFFGDTLAKDIDIPLSRVYAEARRRGDVKVKRKPRGRKDFVGTSATIRRELGVLLAAANHARKWKRLGAEAMPSVELPTEPHVEAAWLTKAQLSLVFSKAEGQLLDFCKIAYYTAARRRSIETLTKAQISLAHGTIALDKPGARKTKKRRPTVPLYPEIRPTIERLMLESEGEYLFGAVKHFYKPFVTLLAGLGIEASPHSFRHSRASHMLQDGESLYKVARLLGDTLVTVERVYGHHTVDYLKTNSRIEMLA